METLRIITFSDESGQDTEGKIFVVATVCCLSDHFSEIDAELENIEIKSGKRMKWHKEGYKRRIEYVKLILGNRIDKKTTIYYSIFQNKKDYLKLIASHIAKAIINFADAKKYSAKIYIDKIDKGSLKILQKEIKSYNIRYEKIKGYKEESSASIRLADAICGMIRDITGKNTNEFYLSLKKRIKEI